jgi:hypothetical protein
MKTTCIVCVAALGVFAAACSKKSDDVKPEPGTAASAVSAASAPPSAKTVKFTVDPKSTTSVDMPAPKEHIKADTKAADGTIDVDLMNLANSRGVVKIDLTTFTTHTFDDQDKNDSQTEHARTWLEVIVQGKTNDANRWAVLTINSIDGLSATDLTKVAAVKNESDGNDDVRTVTMTVHGEFLVHGHKVAKDAQVEAKFHYAPGAAADSTPTSVDIKTKTPMHVVLADHDVKPRDNFGSLAQKAFDLLGTKVAQTADISVDLKAKSATP